ncbi:MAG: hypothetical protein QY326_04300 [Bdellovibrionota bacterium]|nr:MAG: hypothetical protein QY326_04300 [Bdellovibrionota bacterium]
MSVEPNAVEVDEIDPATVPIDTSFDPFEVQLDFRPKEERPGDIFRHAGRNFEIAPRRPTLSVTVELKFGKLNTW